MQIDEIISTKRLTLRNLTKSDAGGNYNEWMRDPEILRFLEARYCEFDESKLAKYISDMNRSESDLLLGIFLKAANEHIGNIKLGEINFHHSRGNLGVIIGLRSRWRRGYATEAIEAICDFAGKKMNLHRVYAGCHASNPGSCMAFQNAGFKLEGKLVHHAFVDGEWVDGIIYGRVFST